jgi:hypothetical protein
MESMEMRNFLNRRHFIILICCAGAIIGGIDRKTKNALKVQHVLKTIERRAPRPGSKELSAKMTQPELNDYIAYRLAREKRSLVRKLNVGLLENNHVQGSLKLDARQLNLGLLFGKVLDFDFKGTLHTKAGAGRLDLAALRMNGQPVKPQMLDLLLRALSAHYGTKMGRIDDWYKLPKGVKRVTVHYGWAKLVY